MKEIFDKLSSYNIFNYLLPGILFVVIAKYFIGYDFIQENNLIGVFLYYFAGMIISRFGSLTIEPVLKKSKFIKFSEYSDFISASKKDEMINILSEANNTYRTLTSMLLLLLLLKLYKYLNVMWNISNGLSISIAVVLVLLLFLFAYRKQTNYITKRIRKTNNP